MFAICIFPSGLVGLFSYVLAGLFACLQMFLDCFGVPWSVMERFGVIWDYTAGFDAAPPSSRSVLECLGASWSVLAVFGMILQALMPPPNHLGVYWSVLGPFFSRIGAF